MTETPDDSPFGSQFSIPSNDHDLVTPKASIEPPPNSNMLGEIGDRDAITGHHYHLLEEELDGGSLVYCILLTCKSFISIQTVCYVGRESRKASCV